jgi:hypothetical protein
MIVFTVTFYVFYSPGIYTLVEGTPTQPTYGSVQGIEIIYSFNTIGFFLAFSVMVFAYALWTWAFLPSPALSYTLGVLRGIFGSSVSIRQRIGKRFTILLHSGIELCIKCRIKGEGPEDWFVYRLESSRFDDSNLENIALRHGMSVSDGRLVTWVTNDELHSRTLLMGTAISMLSM